MERGCSKVHSYSVTSLSSKPLRGKVIRKIGDEKGGRYGESSQGLRFFGTVEKNSQKGETIW